MKKILGHFLLGNVLGMILFFGMIKAGIVKNSDVLGESSKGSNNIQIATPTLAPTQTPTTTQTPTPTFFPTPTLSPTPTLTPTPSPTPTPIVAPDNLAHLFSQYANQYGVDEQLLIKIAWCESRFDPGAVNGPYLGLYQFMQERWITYRTQMGHDTNPDLRANPEEAIKTAAYVISLGKLFMWPNCAF
jgi:hypothetical protein